MASYQAAGCLTEAAEINENLIPKFFKAATKWRASMYDLEYKMREACK
jgi:hypothetical protein